MRGQPKTLKPIISADMQYSESMRLIAPDQIKDAIANLAARFITRVRVEKRDVIWTTFKIEDRFDNHRQIWIATVSVEEVK